MAKNIFRPKANFLLLSILEPPFFCVMQARPSRTKQLRGSFSFKHKVIQTFIGSPQSSPWWPLDIWLETSQVRPRVTSRQGDGEAQGREGRRGRGDTNVYFCPFMLGSFIFPGGLISEPFLLNIEPSPSEVFCMSEYRARQARAAWQWKRQRNKRFMEEWKARVMPGRWGGGRIPI